MNFHTGFIYHNHNFFIPKIIVVNDLFKLSLNSYAAKDTICVLFFFDKKDPKLSLSELLSMMTRIQFNPTLFIWPSMWTRLEHAHILLRNNKQHVVLGQKRKCQRVEESGLWRIQRKRGIEVQYLPNGTNAGYM